MNLDEADRADRREIVHTTLTEKRSDPQEIVAAAAVVASQISDGPVMTSNFGPKFVVRGEPLNVADLNVEAAAALEKVMHSRKWNSSWPAGEERNEAIRNLTALRAVLLASDGTPRKESSSATIEMRGFDDDPAERDSLNRSVLVQVLTDLLLPSQDVKSAPLTTGPKVIGIEGAWGSGKTSTMNLIYRNIKAREREEDERSAFSLTLIDRITAIYRSRRLTPWEALRTTSRLRSGDLRHSLSDAANAEQGQEVSVPIVTRFNPWAHQTSEQVWAALVRTVNQAVIPHVFRSRGEQNRFWFTGNVARLDAGPIRRAIWRGVISLLLRVSVFALIVPVVVQFLRSDSKLFLWGITEIDMALLLPISLASAGLFHTAVMLFFGRVDALLPAELFVGPVLSNTVAVPASSSLLQDPLYFARSGYLYLAQHDVQKVLNAMSEAGRDLVIFIDDLDRCSPSATVEVLQAVNLFASGDLKGCRFVLGLDQSIVAAQITQFYGQDSSGSAMTIGDDPSPGWSFLRKMIQLTVFLPNLNEDDIALYADALLGPEAGLPDAMNNLQVRGPGSGSASEQQPLARREDVDPLHILGFSSSSASSVYQVRSQLIERHPIVREFLRNRMASNAYISAREIKRYLTAWQFYLRVTVSSKEQVSEEDGLLVAYRVAGASEIMVRWPSMIRHVTRVIDGQPALARLAAAINDDVAWGKAVAKVSLDKEMHNRAVKGLRKLLQEGDAFAVAETTLKFL
ncbi:P-loop NTPase fold protein [Actinoplanes sp. NPDC049265]|uniref:KAP family P-loop NTPase fold protein n=1 Tax=Actinoplanes sp. NPDC049265 TaxID=3363902 RepID=UPI003716A657